MKDREKIWSDKLLGKFPELASGNDPFTVPENYFDRLPEKIRVRMSSGGRPLKKRLVPGIIFRPVTVVVATLIIITVVLGYFLKDRNVQSFKDNPDLTVDEILEIYPDFLDNTDEDVFIEVYLATSGKDATVSNIFGTDSSLTTGGILEYLENEDIETESFYNL